MGKTATKKAVIAKQDDSAGAIGSARDMVSQLQEQAKNGQIDGAMLDQLAAILQVSVDAAEDAQSEMKTDAEAVTSVDSAPVPPTELPSEDELQKETEEPSDEEEIGEELEETVTESSVQKSVEPASARPPKGVTLMFDNAEDYRRKLGDFVAAMEAGQMKKAQAIAGNDSKSFDTLFNMAQHALLTEGGWTSGNLAKLSGLAAGDPLQKSISSASVPGIYLIRLAKLMLPVYAGLVNRLPADAPKTGSDQAIWKAQLGFGSLDESGFFRIAEGSIGVQPPTSFLTFTAPYNDLSANESVTLKALRASAGYADPLQIGVIKAMSALLRGQERVVLGGNKAAIAAPGTVTVVSSGSTGGAISAGSTICAVTALTYEGWLAQSKGGSAAVGESTASNTSVLLLTGSTSSIVLTWDAVPGAVAYNVYMAAAGTVAGSAAKWNKTVLVNKATITANSSGSYAPPAADTTVNDDYGIEGIIAWCEKATILGNAIPDKQTIYDNAAGGLTAANGGISQFDEVLADLWTQWHTAPSLMIMSPNMNATLVGKLQSLGSGTFYRVDVTQERNTVNGGMMVTGYVNKFAPYADGTPRMIDVMPHPYMPDGTVCFLSETIPYPMANETRGFVRDVLLPYTYFPLPSQSSGTNKIEYNFAVTTSEVVECFNPGPQAAIVGIDRTL